MRFNGVMSLPRDSLFDFRFWILDCRLLSKRGFQILDYPLLEN